MDKNKGFSVLEMVVVTAIIALIGGFVFTNLSNLGGSVRLTASANGLFDILKAARHNSVSVKIHANNYYPSYGVYLVDDSSEVIVYADCTTDDNGDGKLDELDEFDYNPAACGGEGLVKKHTLPYDGEITAIRSINWDGSSANESHIYLEFLRPEPTIWITLASGDLLDAGRLEIDVEDARRLFKRTLVIWSTGQFSIKN